MRANSPIGAAPIISAPRRPSTYSSPARACRSQLREISFNVLAVARLVDDARTEMVLQIVADPRQFVDHRDAVLAQQIARPDPGKLQQLRRLDRAAGEQYLGARPDAVDDAVLHDIRGRPRACRRTARVARRRGSRRVRLGRFIAGRR